MAQRVNELEDELVEARSRAAELESVEVQRNLLRRQLADLSPLKLVSAEAGSRQKIEATRDESAADAVMRTLSFRLGHSLLQAGQSWRGFRDLPRKLIALRREWSRRRIAGPQSNAAETSWLIEQVLARCSSDQYMGGLAWLARQEASLSRQALVTIQVARDLRQRSTEVAYHLTLEALKLDPKLARARWIAYSLFDSGHVSRAQEILKRADLSELNASENNRVRQLKFMTDDSIAFNIPRRSHIAIAADPKSVLVCANQSVPYHLNSQTLRDKFAVDALAKLGWKTTVVTDPGYPASKSSSSRVVEINDQHSFVRLPAGDALICDYPAISAFAACQILEVVKTHRPSVIVATGDFVMSHAAISVARRCGLRAVLDLGEIRAPWSPPMLDEECGERSLFLLRRMAELANKCDAVLVRTSALGEALRAQGADASLIQCINAPCVVAGSLPARPELRKNLGLSGAMVIGHIGHIAPHRGFLTMLEGLREVGELQSQTSVLLAGPTQHKDRLQEMFHAVWPNGHLALPGRISPHEFYHYAELIDIWVEATATSATGRLASPFEMEMAVAMGISIAAPDLPVYRERLAGYQRAYFYGAGTAGDLARALKEINAARLDEGLIKPTARTDSNASLANWA